MVPVFGRDGGLIGVLDVDSDAPAAFDDGDAAALEALMARDLRGATADADRRRNIA